MSTIIKTLDVKAHQGPVYAIVAHSNTTLLSAGSDNMLKAWDLSSSTNNNWGIPFQATLYALYVIEEKDKLLIGDAIGNIHLFDLKSKKIEQSTQFHKSAVFDIKYHALSNTVLSVSMDGSLVASSLPGMHIKDVQKIGPAKLRKLEIYNNEVFICAGNGIIYTYHLQGKTVQCYLNAHDLSANVCRKILLNNKEILISGGRDALLKVWREKAKEPLVIKAHNFAIYEIDFSVNHTLMATASRDKTIKIWDLQTLTLLHRIDYKTHKGHTHSVNTLKWLEHGLFSSGDDGRIIGWRIDE